MNTLPGKPGSAPKPAMPAFGAFSTSKASKFLEKSNPGLGRSTPDSEALASSDDEAEQGRSRQAFQTTSLTNPKRRTSWLNEIPSTTRKPSVSTTTPYSPTTSNPGTPLGEQPGWGPAGSPSLGVSGGWNVSSGNSYPWGGIWNTDTRKEPPSRLQEVLPSPTAVNAPVASFLTDESRTNTGRGTLADATIPFSIPLHPTPKTYRSQSYSVGQLDPEAVSLTSNVTPLPLASGRGRGGGPYPGLQRRSSRPGALNERGHDSGMLGQVREVDDDEEHETPDVSRDKDQQAALKIEQLTRENARLRQAAARKQDSRLRDRITSSPANMAALDTDRPSPLQSSLIRGGLFDNTDLAVDDFDESASQPGSTGHDVPGKTLSKHSTPDTERLAATSADTRNLENLKRAHWQSSLGFPDIVEPPQSRRHSFADVPTRHGSISSGGDAYNDPATHEPEPGRQDHKEGYRAFGEGSQDIRHAGYRKSSQVSLARLDEEKLELECLRVPRFAAAYFSGPSFAQAPDEEPRRSLLQAYSTPHLYGRDIGYGSSSAQHMQPLYIVGFKCCRSDVFYIQEGTGLQVKLGDLVIVEADRGTDLGTVQNANITWDEARQLKETYAEEHYKWLMMFSKQSQAGGPNAFNPNGLSGPNGAPGSAVGGMGPPGHHGAQEPQSTELKPKLIKRLAQRHEVLTLKDKEGNEARAKRMCQQKVVEHRLNMEILDAEFQMDGKKLTFYYFADTYINFNSLVTDLFKMYKTRIWMSAINPASFVTPTASLHPSNSFSIISAGSHDSHANRRRQQFGAPTGYDESLEQSRGFVPSQGNGLQNPYFNPYNSMATGMQGPGPGVIGYPQNGQPTAEPFAAYLTNPYQMLNPAASAFASAHGSVPRSGRPAHSPTNDIPGKFQGLSLGH